MRNRWPFPFVEKAAGIDQDVTLVSDDAPVLFKLQLPSTSLFIPDAFNELGVELHLSVEIVLVGRAFEVSPYFWAGCVERGPVRIRLKQERVNMGRDLEFHCVSENTYTY